MKKLLLAVLLVLTTLVSCSQISTQKFKSKSLLVFDSSDRGARYDGIEYNIVLTKNGDSVTHFLATILGGKSSFRLKVREKYAERASSRNQVSSFYFSEETVIKLRVVFSIVRDAKTNKVNSFGVWMVNTRLCLLSTTR